METGYLSQASQAIWVALQLATPVLAVTLILGVLIGIFQAVSSIQEQTLSFVPKIFAAGATLVFFGSWMFRTLNDFAVGIFNNLHTFVR